MLVLSSVKFLQCLSVTLLFFEGVDVGVDLFKLWHHWGGSVENLSHEVKRWRLGRVVGELFAWINKCDV